MFLVTYVRSKWNKNKAYAQESCLKVLFFSRFITAFVFVIFVTICYGWLHLWENT